MTLKMSGAENGHPGAGRPGVEHVFGYPGGAVLPIYDELFQQDKVKHVLVAPGGRLRCTPPRDMRARPARLGWCS